MANLHIHRHHTLGLRGARSMARQWVAQVEAEFGLACTYTEGPTVDHVCFSRPGVRGTLSVTQNTVELRAQLGLLVGAFKAMIEKEIVRNLDDLLRPRGAPVPRGKKK